VCRANAERREFIISSRSSNVACNDPNGQVFVFFIMAVAAAEVAVGLGYIKYDIQKHVKSIDTHLLSNLKQ
jgi:NADH-quinone oxidoreductase subunit K